VRQPLPTVAAAYEYPQFSRIQHSPPIRPRAFMRPLELAVGCRMRRYLQLFVVPNLQEHPKQSCSAARTAPEPVDSVVGALRILGKGLFELLTYSHLKQLRYWDIPDLIMSLESEHSRSSNALRPGHTRSTSSASTSLSCDERPPAGWYQDKCQQQERITLRGTRQLYKRLLNSMFFKNFRGRHPDQQPKKGLSTAYFEWRAQSGAAGFRQSSLA
jgi:hypothetical protein